MARLLVKLAVIGGTIRSICQHITRVQKADAYLWLMQVLRVIPSRYDPLMHGLNVFPAYQSLVHPTMAGEQDLLVHIEHGTAQSFTRGHTTFSCIVHHTMLRERNPSMLSGSSNRNEKPCPVALFSTTHQQHCGHNLP